jgi:hypothetical protein
MLGRVRVKKHSTTFIKAHSLSFSLGTGTQYSSSIARDKISDHFKSGRPVFWDECDKESVDM